MGTHKIIVGAKGEYERFYFDAVSLSLLRRNLIIYWPPIFTYANGKCRLLTKPIFVFICHQMNNRIQFGFVDLGLV